MFPVYLLLHPRPSSDVCCLIGCLSHYALVSAAQGHLIFQADLSTPQEEPFVAVHIRSPYLNQLSCLQDLMSILLLAGYHLLALGLFLPALLWEPQLLAVSLAIALTLLILVEIVRLGQVPYLGEQVALALCHTC